MIARIFPRDQAELYGTFTFPHLVSDKTAVYLRTRKMNQRLKHLIVTDLRRGSCAMIAKYLSISRLIFDSDHD